MLMHNEECQEGENIIGDNNDDSDKDNKHEQTMMTDIEGHLDETIDIDDR